MEDKKDCCIINKKTLMTKSLFFDIDGTLVSLTTHRISPSTIEALEIAHDKKNKIFIVTGRLKSIINNLSELQNRGLIDGYITMNGVRFFTIVGTNEEKIEFCEKIKTDKQYHE
jgi:HAD superfamily hydrolase (TIGR01484 family)